MSADLTPWLNLITSEHNQKPNFIASLSAILQPIADEIATQCQMSGDAFNVDTAVGAQLDIIGLWVGVSRNIEEPLTGVYFSFDITGVGYDQGVWKGPFDPSTGLAVLPDDAYRTLIYATIAANQWDGTIPGAYAAWAQAFPADKQVPILIQDNGDMSMDIVLTQPNPDAVTLALFTEGYIKLKPAGVRLNAMVPSVSGAPVFGFDIVNTSIAGFDTGVWAKVLGVS